MLNSVDFDTRYAEFLKRKLITTEASGFSSDYVNPKLFGWQTDIVHWCLKKGKCCVFSDCGSGKTAIQLQWAKEVCEHTGGKVLILAPLAVSQQTKREGEKFGIEVNICRDQRDVKDGVNITNYEIAQKFDPQAFVGVVLDESSILKHGDAKTRVYATEAFRNTPYKLCCTATPAPNDYMELGTHSEFIGVMKQTEMLSTFFVHDGGETQKWRLKGHAASKFFEWVASWACCMTRPQDLGYEQEGYDLPELRIHECVTESKMIEQNGQMMFIAPTAMNLNERRDARRNSIEERVALAKQIATSVDPGEQVLIWCGLNAEQDAIAEALGDLAFSIQGSTPDDKKVDYERRWRDGERPVLVTKVKCFGFGMNWQQCHKMIFVGLSDSFEAYYQAIRRCWRFGQENPVDVYIIISEAEGAVRDNIERKQRDAERMTAELVKYTKDILKADIQATTRISETYYATEIMIVPDWLKGEAA